MPADQRAREREEGFLNVGPLVVTHTQAAKLIQPRERAFHYPTPPSQATTMLLSPHSDSGEDMTGS